MPQRVSIGPPELRMALYQPAKLSSQWVSLYIISDHDRRRTGYHYKGEQGFDMMDKHNDLGKAINDLVDKPTDDRSSSDEEEKRNSKKVKHPSRYGG